MNTTNRVIDASAGGTFLNTDAAGLQKLSGARLVSAGAASSAVIRETNGSGRILCALAAPINSADDSDKEVAFTGAVHVTVTGAGATVLLYQR